MKIKKKIISGLLTATTLVSLCAFSAGAVSTDKKFSVEDATLIQKNVVGMTTFDEKQIKLYDLNKDGVITVVDSTLVQKIIVGLIKEPTEEQPTTAELTTGAYNGSSYRAYDGSSYRTYNGSSYRTYNCSKAYYCTDRH